MNFVAPTGMTDAEVFIALYQRAERIHMLDVHSSPPIPSYAHWIGPMLFAKFCKLGVCQNVAGKNMRGVDFKNHPKYDFTSFNEAMKEVEAAQKAISSYRRPEDQEPLHLSMNDECAPFTKQRQISLPLEFKSELQEMFINCLKKSN